MKAVITKVSSACGSHYKCKHTYTIVYSFWCVCQEKAEFKFIKISLEHCSEVG